MPQADLLIGVRGSGGGLIGQNHNVRLMFQFVEHALEKKAEDKVTVTKRYPTATFCEAAIEVEDADVDPQYKSGKQYFQVGRLPLWRTQQLNEPPDKNQVNYPGGFMPSLDGDKPATAGPFVYVEAENGIWEGCEYMIFIGELTNLASAAGQLDNLKAAVAKGGVFALNGLRCKLGTKAKPKGKNAKAEDRERTVLVPVQINAWPWEAAAVAPKVAAPAIAKPVAAAAPVPTIAPPAIASPAVASANGASDLDALAIARIKQAVKKNGGMVALTDLVARVFADTADMTGVERAGVMQRVYNSAFIAAAAASGQFLSDGTSVMAT